MVPSGVLSPPGPGHQWGRSWRRCGRWVEGTVREAELSLAGSSEWLSCPGRTAARSLSWQPVPSEQHPEQWRGAETKAAWSGTHGQQLGGRGDAQIHPAEKPLEGTEVTWTRNDFRHLKPCPREGELALMVLKSAQVGKRQRAVMLGWGELGWGGSRWSRAHPVYETVPFPLSTNYP